MALTTSITNRLVSRILPRSLLFCLKVSSDCAFDFLDGKPPSTHVFDPVSSSSFEASSNLGTFVSASSVDQIMVGYYVCSSLEEHTYGGA